MVPPPMASNGLKKMRILGVFFNNGLVSVDNDNWKTKLDKLKTVLNLWSSRELSFIGRSMILNLSCKCIYALFLTLPRDAPRCVGFWDSALCRPINRWATVWRKSRLKLNENKKNDLLWLILHRAVRVRYSLIRTDRCAICGRIENIEHCFLACPRVVRVWNYFSPLLSRLSDSTFVVSIPSVFHPLSDDQVSPLFSLFTYFLATILYWIWLARNSATFRNSIQS